MRRRFLAPLFLAPVGIFVMGAGGQSSPPVASVAQADLPPAAHSCDSHCNAKWMDTNLRLDQMQVVATAESYKQRPAKSLMGLIRMGGKKDAEALDYGLPSLATQLDSDIRGLQFDIAYDPKGGAYKKPAGANMAMELLSDDYLRAMARPGFKVIHVLDVDYGSSCLALADCLKQVAQWSSAHPRHLPIIISLKMNDAKTPMPGATSPTACDEAAMDALDAEIRTAFDPGQMITPDEVQANHATLREAVLAHAWPTLAQARGKVVFVLNDSAVRAKTYQGARKSLQGRALFVATDESSPLAAFVSIADPVKDAGRIQQAVHEGFMVLTRADDETREARENNTARREAAFASGAQIVQTDFPAADPAIGSYRVSLADNPDAMCGKALAPEHCVRIADPNAVARTVAAAMP